VTAEGRWVSVLWPLLLLALFAATFRRMTPNEDLGPAALECDSLDVAPPTESAGVDIDQLERCLTLDPRNAELLLDLGRAYAASKRLDKAEHFYRRALTIDPINSDLHVLLGGLLMDRGERDGARREGEAALRWRPNSLAASRLVSRASAMPGQTP
jgi:tetratricopeptide (TPR) repeat protein